MLDDIRHAAARQRTARAVRRMKADCKRLLGEKGELGGMAITADLIERLDGLADEDLEEFFDYLAHDLSPDPQRVLKLAQAYADTPGPDTLFALTHATEPARQELFRRLNRMPGGTGAVLRLRRALLKRLKDRPDLRVIEADLLHLLTSWFNPGFLQVKRVDWNSPAQLLEKIIHHEAVHAVDGWDDLRRRLQPDRRCFAFFHPQLRDEPLIFVEVALLPEMPAAIGPLIDKSSTPMATDRYRVAAFYSISNCEPGPRRQPGQLPHQDGGPAAAARAAAAAHVLHAVADPGPGGLAAVGTRIRRPAAAAQGRRGRARRRARAAAHAVQGRPQRLARPSRA